MLNIYLANIFENNRQLEPIVIGFAIAVIVVLIVVLIVLKAKDKRKEKLNEQIDTAWKAEQVVNRSVSRSAKSEKKIHQIKRKNGNSKEEEQSEADSKNTLLGGKSDAQREAVGASQVFGSLGISSKKAESIDKEKDRIIINGYLQKSNTAPIRPVYSNTLEARQKQREELDSDKVGKEAETPALVMDSAAPSVVKITDAPVQKVKPTALKRPTSSRIEKSE